MDETMVSELKGLVRCILHLFQMFTRFEGTEFKNKQIQIKSRKVPRISFSKLEYIV